MRSLVVVALTLFAGIATAAPQFDPPCKGCVIVPASASPAPLLVVLHGDGQSATSALEPWKSAARARGVALFAPKVPNKGSWWKWDGDPKVIDGWIDAIDGVDPRRIFVAGWSGGASYLGRRTRDLPARWAALSIDGGGWAPDDLTCPSRIPPAYFLVGDKNELHDLAKELRAHWEKCGAEIVWDLVPGANHAGEWSALGKKSGGVLDWLLAHPLASASASAVASASVSAFEFASASAPAIAPGSATETASEPMQPVRGRCGCEVPGGGGRGAPGGVIVAMLAVIAVTSRRFGVLGITDASA